jgi:RNA polymerase-binding transcription factor DksA
MAKKVTKKAKASKPAKKASKPAAKKASKPAKKAAKPAKKVKPVAKKAAKPAKKVAKPIAKKAAKPAKKVVPAKAAKKTVKDLMVKKGKPIDAIKKMGKPDAKGKKGKKKGGDDDDDDVDVKDDYEKGDEDDVLDGDLEEPAVLDVDGDIPPPADDDDDDEVPIKKGRGRRKKSDGTSKGGSMEAYIRNRPLQIDLSKPLIKKSAEAQPKPFVNTKDNRSRYPDKELAEFKELILEKLKEAQADYDLLKQTLSNEDNHGTDDTSPTFKLLEDGSDVLSKEETAQLAARQEKYIINLKNALVRIENKTYGICRVTGKLIPKERLRSVPHATLGIDAKLNQNR